MPNTPFLNYYGNDQPKRQQSHTYKFIQEIYGRVKSEEEKQFTDSIGEKLGWKVAVMFALNLWVGIASHCKLFVIAFQHHKTARCTIQELEGHFTDEQIANMSLPNPELFEEKIFCEYNDLNYKNLIERHGYNYDGIMGEISNLSDIKMKSCVNGNITTRIPEAFNDIGEVENFFDHFDMYCKPSYIKKTFAIILKYGQFTISPFIGLLGDVKGRKYAFVVVASIFTVGLILTATSNIILNVIGRYFIGAHMILFFSSFVIFLEYTNKRGRRRHAMLIYEGIAIGKFIEYILYRTTKSWKWVTTINAIFCVVMLLPAIYIPESPRWLYMRGNKKRAYKILGEDRPNQQDHLNPMDYKEHFANYTKSVFRRRLLIMFVMAWCTSAVTYMNRNKFSRLITNFYLRQLLDSGFFMAVVIFLVYLVMKYFKRLQVIIGYFSINCILGATIFLNPLINIIYVQICLVIHLSLTENATFFTFFTIAELFSINMRFTSYGLITSIHGLSEIVNFHFNVHDIPIKSLFYYPLFVYPSISFVMASFQSETIYQYHLADYPREAIGEDDYKDITKQYQYEKSKSQLQH